MKFVTFNVRGAWYADEENALIHRVGMIFKKIEEEDPDVVCFQEVDESIKEFFQKFFGEYFIFGTGREADYTGEMMAVMIKKSAVELLGFETFWLSETPYAAGSRFDNQSEYPRVVTAAMLKEKATNKPFIVYNVHLDIWDGAALSGVKKVLARLSEDRKKYNMPFIMAGDFNSAPDSETMKLCFGCKNPVLCEHTGSVKLTRHGFMNPDEMKKIDYIFTDEKTAETVSDMKVWEDKKDGIFLSDHFPISVEFNLL